MELFVWCFCLVLARVASFITVLPLFGTLGMPRLVKAGLVLALTMIWYVPIAEAIPPAQLLQLSNSISLCGHAAAIAREMFLGGTLGFGLGLFLVPVHVCGEFLSQEMGLAFANQVNPATGASSSPLTKLLEYLAIAVFFGVDGHHVLLGVLHGSFKVRPWLRSGA
jgi:flagellar biosynthesis protein FliR